MIVENEVKNFDQKKCWVKKTIYVKKIVNRLKRFLSQKNFWIKKKFRSKNFGSKYFWVRKIIRSKKFGSKAKFLVKNNLG